jgi:hypothetical protein
MSSILLRSLFYRGSEFIILLVFRVFRVQAMLMMMQV